MAQEGMEWKNNDTKERINLVQARVSDGNNDGCCVPISDELLRRCVELEKRVFRQREEEELSVY